MTEFEKQKLGKTLWNIADQLRGAMNADDFRDYMLAFLFLGMEEIEKNDFNLNISRYVSTAQAEEEIDLAAVHADLVAAENKIADAKARHNQYLAELGLPPLP